MDKSKINILPSPATVRFFILSCFFLFLSSVAFSQSYADAILGKWKSEDGKTVVEIYKSGNEYKGKIVWLAVPNDGSGNPRTDLENPDPKKRSRPLMGLTVLYHLYYEDGYWQDGEIYNSQNGETYDVDVWLEGKDTLNLKVYWYFMHETQTWKKLP